MTVRSKGTKLISVESLRQLDLFQTIIQHEIINKSSQPITNQRYFIPQGDQFIFATSLLASPCRWAFQTVALLSSYGVKRGGGGRARLDWWCHGRTSLDRARSFHAGFSGNPQSTSFSSSVIKPQQTWVYAIDTHFKKNIDTFFQCYRQIRIFLLTKDAFKLSIHSLCCCLFLSIVALGC